MIFLQKSDIFSKKVTFQQKSHFSLQSHFLEKVNFLDFRPLAGAGLGSGPARAGGRGDSFSSNAIF